MAAFGALASLALAAAAEVAALRPRGAAPAGSGSYTSRAGLRGVLQPLAVAVALLALARLLPCAASLMWRALTAPLPVRLLTQRLGHRMGWPNVTLTVVQQRNKLCGKALCVGRMITQDLGCRLHGEQAHGPYALR